ncbi:DUF4112 domain-containing protein [Haloplanus aerogenes]|uniref:Uncharacterized protein DUF4112 n=1 Tax=Haloplanus aerogenes TaxID=660522 RepID=A0A3M0DQJ8_9EURY|nr:DUF4112 domain-containing protein [Haloplanus aerogenes]RMB23942.1 uncharacterized protein DUF4112 [Haloplanus aerogenes]
MTGASRGSAADGGRDGDEPTVVTVDRDTAPARNPATAVDLQRLRDLSHLLDDSIRVPGTDFRIGIEPLIGLLPVVGDAVGLAISTYVFAVAARSGVPRATLGRVAVVLWIDAVGGAVPVLGDLFDAYWKANLRVSDLLDARLDDPASAAADRRYLRRLAAVAVVCTLVVVAVLAVLVWWLLGYVGAV